MEYKSIKNNSGIIGKFPGIIQEVLGSDDDKEDDLSSDYSCWYSMHYYYDYCSYT